MSDNAEIRFYCMACKASRRLPAGSPKLQCACGRTYFRQQITPASIDRAARLAKKEKKKAGGGEVKPPPFAKQILSFAAEVRRWINAGRPNRSKEEYERIRDQVCKPCEFSNKNATSCRVCGCRLRPKIKMATTSCPLDDPKWTAEENA